MAKLSLFRHEVSALVKGVAKVFEILTKIPSGPAGIEPKVNGKGF
jgi:hypothetical protein